MKTEFEKKIDNAIKNYSFKGAIICLIVSIGVALYLNTHKTEFNDIIVLSVDIFAIALFIAIVIRLALLLFHKKYGE